MINVNRKKRQVDLSIKALLPEPVKEAAPPADETRGKAPRPQEAKGKRPRKKQKETFEVPQAEGEPMITAMAAAYAALQDNKDDQGGSAKPAETSKKQNKKEHDMDSIVARTLASRESS